MADELDDWLNAYNFENDYMPIGLTNEPDPDLPNQVNQASTGIDPGYIPVEELSDESDTENKLLEERVRFLEASLSKYRKSNIRMCNQIKELPSRDQFEDLRAEFCEIAKNIEGLQSKLPEIHANNNARDLQHIKLCEKIDNLQAWASNMKGTLDKTVNAMKYMRGQNENTSASIRQRNSQRIHRNKANQNLAR